MNYYKELLYAKLALFKMIDQFMYETTDDDFNEYFDDYCESAGEAAFSVLGFEDDRIRKEEFYQRYDELFNEIYELNHGEPSTISRFEYYLKEKEKIQERLRINALCNGCVCQECCMCPYDDDYHCHGCPCDTCEIVDGRRSNYHTRDED